MDFVEYGEYAARMHIQDDYSRFPVSVFTGAKTKEWRSSEIALVTAIPHRLALFRAPYISIVDEDMGFIGYLSRFLLIA